MDHIWKSVSHLKTRSYLERWVKLAKTGYTWKNVHTRKNGFTLAKNGHLEKKVRLGHGSYLKKWISLELIGPFRKIGHT